MPERPVEHVPRGVAPSLGTDSQSFVIVGMVMLLLFGLPAMVWGFHPGHPITLRFLFWVGCILLWGGVAMSKAILVKDPLSLRARVMGVIILLLSPALSGLVVSGMMLLQGSALDEEFRADAREAPAQLYMQPPPGGVEATEPMAYTVTVDGQTHCYMPPPGQLEPEEIECGQVLAEGSPRQEFTVEYLEGRLDLHRPRGARWTPSFVKPWLYVCGLGTLVTLFLGWRRWRRDRELYGGSASRQDA
jgi:hypothetical protein